MPKIVRPAIMFLKSVEDRIPFMADDAFGPAVRLMAAGALTTLTGVARRQAGDVQEGLQVPRRIRRSCHPGRHGEHGKEGREHGKNGAVT